MSFILNAGQSISLFWRLFLSLLAMLLITSTLSVGIERWLSQKQLNNRMQTQVEQLLVVRQEVTQQLQAGNFQKIRQLYREDRGFMTQIRIIDEQGQIIFPKFRKHLNKPLPPHMGMGHRTQPPPKNSPSDIFPPADSRGQISTDTIDYPEIADIIITDTEGKTYTVQLQPRLLLRDIAVLRQDYNVIRMALIVLFSSLVCYWISRTLTRRIRQVQRTVHRMSAGNYDKDSNLYELGSDELGMLAKDVSKLSTRLAESELARKQMLSDISHELRSPLARLDVATELTRDFAPNAHSYLDRIQKESTRMNELIEQIMHIQSLQMQRYSSELDELETVNLPHLIDEIGDDVCFEFHDKQISFIWKNPTSDDSHHASLNQAWSILGHQEQLYSAIENIIRNAFIHTPQHSQVEIMLNQTTLIEDQSALEIQIRDTGQGVAEADLERIFQPFVRVSKSRERLDYTDTKVAANKKTANKKTRGYGLGLAIAHAVIMAHKGHLHAHNRTDGSTGLIITIVLPTQSS